MDTQDRKAIEDLFGKLANVEQQAAPRDTEAETFVRDRLNAQPAAAYYMAQTIIVQEQALAAAEARLKDMESRASSSRDEPRGGGIFGSLFGGSERSAPRPAPQAVSPAPPSRGGGFLAGAAQTAMGVAGGMFLGSAVAGMFGGDDAHAAEPADVADEPTPDVEADEGGGFFDDLGGDW